MIASLTHEAEAFPFPADIQRLWLPSLKHPEIQMLTRLIRLGGTQRGDAIDPSWGDSDAKQKAVKSLCDRDALTKTKEGLRLEWDKPCPRTLPTVKPHPSFDFPNVIEEKWLTQLRVPEILIVTRLLLLGGRASLAELLDHEFDRGKLRYAIEALRHATVLEQEPNGWSLCVAPEDTRWRNRLYQIRTELATELL